jgi:hypothetical protein
VRTLNRYKDAPNKDLGEGLNTAFQKMKEWGLKEPIISEDGNYVGPPEKGQIHCSAMDVSSFLS